MRTEILAGLLLLAAAPLASAADPAANTQYAAQMAHAHRHDKPIASPAAARATHAVSASEVTYGESGGKPLRGYLAFPVDAYGARPGILVFHEWWGLNDNIQSMTRQLAEQGYAALALDLYDGDIATTADDAQAAMTRALGDPKALSAKFDQGFDYLKHRLHATRVGTIGWCFGGAMSYEAGVQLGRKLDAVVIYYGRTSSDPQELKHLTAPVLGLFGGKDAHITPDSARDFDQAMKALHRSVEVHIYPDANHAFANPSGQAYEPKAAEDAWRRTTQFLARHLKR